MGILFLMAFVGLAKIEMASRMALVVRVGLSFWSRQTPTRSSIYPSIQPLRGMFRWMSAGRAGANGMSAARRIGIGMDDGSGCEACVFFGSQNGLFVISFAIS